MAQPGFQLDGLEGRQAEVVEEVLPQLQVAQLGRRDEEEERLEGHKEAVICAAVGRLGQRLWRAASRAFGGNSVSCQWI